MLPRIQYLTVSCSYLYVSPLSKHTHVLLTVHLPKLLFMHSVELFFLLLATFVSHCDKMPRLQVCIFSATICGQRKVAAGEEIDGVGMVMDTGSLAQLRAPHPPGISYHCLAPPFSWHSLWLNWLWGEDLAWGGFLPRDNNRPQTGEVAVCIVHCGTGLSNAGSLCIVQCLWKGICGL